jgi:hypothetical protein
MARRIKVAPHGTQELDKAVRAFRAAEAKLATTMLEAHDGGSSLRTIAMATGLSHETVRGILVRERRRVAAVEAQLARPIAGQFGGVRDREEARRRRTRAHLSRQQI